MARIIADVILSAAGIELGEVAVIKAAKAILLQGFFPEGKGMKMGEIVYLSPCKLNGRSYASFPASICYRRHLICATG